MNAAPARRGDEGGGRSDDVDDYSLHRYVTDSAKLTYSYADYHIIFLAIGNNNININTLYYVCSLPYIACSSESKEGFCAHVDTTCKRENICKTCDTFAGNGGACTEIDYFPNATISEYGTYSVIKSPFDVTQRIMAEIYARGPVAAGVNAEPLVEYTGGIVKDTSFLHMMNNHIVSIVGWVSYYID